MRGHYIFCLTNYIIKNLMVWNGARFTAFLVVLKAYSWTCAISLVWLRFLYSTMNPLLVTCKYKLYEGLPLFNSAQKTKISLSPYKTLTIDSRVTQKRDKNGAAEDVKRPSLDHRLDWEQSQPRSSGNRNTWEGQSMRTQISRTEYLCVHQNLVSKYYIPVVKVFGDGNLGKKLRESGVWKAGLIWWECLSNL